MVDLRAQLGDVAFERLMNGIALGRYQLLLGAGASVTSTDRYGEQLPTGEVLRKEVIEEFDLPRGGAPNLKRVFAAAKNRQARDGSSLSQYVKNRFTGTNPAAWYEDLLRLQWAGIWTLNIDDCVEVAGNRLGNQARQRLISISWAERHRQAERSNDEVLLVHLHGKASRGREDELVFDISSYVNSLTEHHRWQKIFGDEFPSRPFIVIGASLDDEIDLQSTFEEKRADPDTPSIIVLKDIDEFQRSEYESYGLTPVESTAEDFIAAVRSELPSFTRALLPDELIAAAGTSLETVRFLEQWRRLSLPSAARADRHHDLYAGHEPRWSDAATGLISSRQAIAALRRDLTGELDPGHHALLLAAGESFSGKSSLVLRACKEIVERGMAVFLFNGDSAIDGDAVLHWIQRVPNSVLVIDDAADWVRDIELLLDDERMRNLTARILLVDRLSRLPHIESTLISHNYRKVGISATLTSSEVDALVAKLSEKRRLGVLTTLGDRERKQYFRTHGSKLFSAMAALEDGRGFRSRVTEEFDRVTDKSTKRLLAVTGVTNRLGYGLPLEVVKTAAGLTAKETQTVVDGDLSDLVAIENDSVTARHKIFGELLVSYLPRDARQRAIIDLALAVAPHVSPAAISNSTLYYRIARTLMGRAMLLELLDNSLDDVLVIFEQIEEAYSWNARFWEQRALTAADNLRFESAFSWGQQALTRRRDAYSLTTVGTVLMQRAAHESRDGVWPADTFEKANEYLTEARRLEGDQASYPIETFFSYTTRLITNVPVRDRALNTQIASLWTSWYTSILEMDPTTQLRLVRVRESALADWDRFELDASGALR